MSVKLTVLWKGNSPANASPKALSDDGAGTVIQGVIQQSGRAAAVTIERADLERLLAERRGGKRSALQAVRDSYSEVEMLRERSVPWGEIAEMLGQNGAVGRDGKAFAASTVRAAFFLVGAEIRQGQAGEDSAAVEVGEDEITALRAAVADVAPPDALAAVEPAAPAVPLPWEVPETRAAPALVAVEAPEPEFEAEPVVGFAAEAECEAVPESEPEPDLSPDSDDGPEYEPEPLPEDEAGAEPDEADEAAKTAWCAPVHPSWMPDQSRIPVPPMVNRPAPRSDDMLLLMPIKEALVVRAAEVERLDEVPPPIRAAEILPKPMAPPVRPVVAPAASPAEARPLGAGPRTAETAMKWDWTRRADSST